MIKTSPHKFCKNAKIRGHVRFNWRDLRLNSVLTNKGCSNNAVVTANAATPVADVASADTSIDGGLAVEAAVKSLDSVRIMLDVTALPQTAESIDPTRKEHAAINAQLQYATSAIGEAVMNGIGCNVCIYIAIHSTNALRASKRLLYLI
jgi:hypothetical protein